MPEPTVEVLRTRLRAQLKTIRQDVQSIDAAVEELKGQKVAAEERADLLTKILGVPDELLQEWIVAVMEKG